MKFLKRKFKKEDAADLLVQLPSLIKEHEHYIIDCRRTVHRYAEVGGTEHKTSAFIRKEAEAMGLTVEQVTETGLLVTLDTGRAGNGVALRADMDALPIAENPHNLKGPRCVVSENPETSHTCGHDAHVGMLLGAMRVLVSLKEQLCGTIYFCFEEGEETGLGWGGMVDALETRKVNTVFALHVSSQLESGLVSVDPGPRMAGIQEIDATFVGRGGHASRPDLSINPVYAAASSVCDLAVAFANQIDPNDPVTLGITSISGGATSNAFPDTAQVLGTMRFFHVDAIKRATKIAKKVFLCSGEMHNCKVEFGPSMSVFLLPTVNDEDATAFARDVFNRVLPEGTIVSMEKWYGSETFSQYLARYKGVYAFLGTGNEELGTTAEHHNEYFDVDESVLWRGSLCYAAYAIEAVADPQIGTWQRSEGPELVHDEEEESERAGEPVLSIATARATEMPEVPEVPEAVQRVVTPTSAKLAKYNLDTKVGVIMKSQQAKDAIESIVTGVVTHPQVNYVKGMSIRKAAKLLPTVLTPEVLGKIETVLAEIEE